MNDITALSQRNDLLIANGQQTADLLRHLADNEIDSDYFVVTSECESYGKETDAELSITEFALRAAGYVEALVEALEARDKQISELVAGRQNLQRTMGVYVHAYEEAKEQIAKDVEIKARLCRESNSLFDRLRAAEKRIAELERENEYIRNRYKELDLIIGKNILVMQAAIIEWQGTGDAKNGLAWIYNTLFGPGELPDEEEKDAQAYFDRKYALLDEELMALHKWFWKQSESERAAGNVEAD